MKEEGVEEEGGTINMQEPPEDPSVVLTALEDMRLLLIKAIAAKAKASS